MGRDNAIIPNSQRHQINCVLNSFNTRWIAVNCHLLLLLLWLELFDRTECRDYFHSLIVIKSGRNWRQHHSIYFSGQLFIIHRLRKRTDFELKFWGEVVWGASSSVEVAFFLIWRLIGRTLKLRVIYIFRVFTHQNLAHCSANRRSRGNFYYLKLMIYDRRPIHCRLDQTGFYFLKWREFLCFNELFYSKLELVWTVNGGREHLWCFDYFVRSNRMWLDYTWVWLF